MPRARSLERDRAKEMWLASDKKCLLKDIAAELDVPENRIRKWKSEDKWESENIEEGKGTLLLENNSLKRSAPIQKGTQDEQTQNRGTTKGNKNSRKHGLYESLYWDSIDDDERLLIEQEEAYQQEELMIIEQIKLLTIRERRLLKTINDYKLKDNGLALNSVIKRTLDIKGNIVHDDRQKQTEITTKTTSTFEVIMKLETELSRVQMRKTKCIETLNRIRNEVERMQLVRLKLGLVEDDVLKKAKELLGVIDSAF